MKVLVTGCDGYIGHNLVPELERRKHDVVGFDALVYGQPRLYSSEMSNADLLKVAAEADVVVHLAALAHDPLGVLPADKVQATNTWPIFAAQHLPKQRHIAVSSMSVFDVENKATYIESKRTLEAGLATHGLWRGIDIIRFGTIYGVTRDTQAVHFRPHLLLNSMVLDGILKGVVTANDPAVQRPVCPLGLAVEALAAAVESPLAPGRVINVLQGSACVGHFAQYVAEILGVEWVEGEAHDPRTYSAQPLLEKADLEPEIQNLREYFSPIDSAIVADQWRATQMENLRKWATKE